MKNGYFAYYADVVMDEFVKGVCPERHEAFIRYIEDAKIEMSDFISYVESLLNAEDLKLSEEKLADGIEILTLLTDEFEEKTGLALALGFHDRDFHGSPHDEVDGWYWQVGNAYQLTEAGQKYADKIQRSFYCVSE